MLLTIQRKDVTPEVVVLEMTGRITLGRNCQDVEWRLQDVMKEERRKVIFDLTQVQHIDSTGVGIIVMSSGKLRKIGGELRVAGASGVVEQALKLTRVDQIISFYDTADAATAGW